MPAHRFDEVVVHVQQPSTPHVCYAVRIKLAIAASKFHALMRRMDFGVFCVGVLF